jgi:hypothetical protein
VLPQLAWRQECAVLAQLTKLTYAGTVNGVQQYILTFKKVSAIPCTLVV